MNEQELHDLLRLQSYIQPSPAAVEKFIVEFQRRQRVASLTPSWWEIGKERCLLFLSEFEVPKLAYVVATALALVSSAFLFIHQDTADQHASSTEAYPIATKNFYRPSSSLVPRGDVIPVSFDEKEEDFSFPDIVFPKKQLEPKKRLLSF